MAYAIKFFVTSFESAEANDAFYEGFTLAGGDVGRLTTALLDGEYEIWRDEPERLPTAEEISDYLATFGETEAPEDPLPW